MNKIIKEMNETIKNMKDSNRIKFANIRESISGIDEEVSKIYCMLEMNELRQLKDNIRFCITPDSSGTNRYKLTCDQIVNVLGKDEYRSVFIQGFELRWTQHITDFEYKEIDHHVYRIKYTIDGVKHTIEYDIDTHKKVKEN